MSPAVLTLFNSRTQVAEKWNPKAGDYIVSNWCSWAEILWLAFRYVYSCIACPLPPDMTCRLRFDPIFVLPVASAPTAVSQNSSSAPGRRTGTGSAAIKSTGQMQRTDLAGFHQVSLWRILSSLGQTPSTNGLALQGAKSLEAIRKTADRPIVVFPECTTSNGRGLLRFAEVFDPSTLVPVKGFNVFVMCAR